VVDIGNQTFEDNNKVWCIARLVKLSESFVVIDADPRVIGLHGLCPNITTLRDFVSNMQRVIDADLSYPIILDNDGYVMDGRHRLAKALLEGKKTIKAVRFDEMPSPCHIKNEVK